MPDELEKLKGANQILSALLDKYKVPPIPPLRWTGKPKFRIASDGSRKVQIDRLWLRYFSEHSINDQEDLLDLPAEKGPVKLSELRRFLAVDFEVCHSAHHVCHPRCGVSADIRPPLISAVHFCTGLIAQKVGRENVHFKTRNLSFSLCG
jgi:hypothetical protein